MMKKIYKHLLSSFFNKLLFISIVMLLTALLLVKYKTLFYSLIILGVYCFTVLITGVLHIIYHSVKQRKRIALFRKNPFKIEDLSKFLKWDIHQTYFYVNKILRLKKQYVTESKTYEYKFQVPKSHKIIRIEYLF